MIVIALDEALTEFSVFDADGNLVKDHELEALQICAEGPDGRIIAGILIGRDVTYAQKEGLDQPETL